MKTILRPRESASDIPPLARGAPPHSLAPAALLTELPASYGTSRLVLMVIDPYWVFAYWEITRAQMAKARRGRPSAMTVLRIYDLTGADGGAEGRRGSLARASLRAPGKRPKPNFSFDIEIVPGADNWYINLWAPQRSLYADLGLRGPDGQFLRIVRSNRVETPPAQASPVRNEQLATVGRRYKSPAPHKGQERRPRPSSPIRRAQGFRAASHLSSVRRPPLDHVARGAPPAARKPTE